ncbi:mitochondrial 54S ribosomal protein YmL41 [Taxawa tesnikishii (nom. ined.)]|nr:mitochondrial 54S ribosomal protein YmL41 [Dothideales sp. JES 119]
MRDYLWHAYNVRAVNIRSFVYQKRPKANHWYRPKSSKKMTVEMDSPFVWPEEPEDYAEWNKETYAQAEKDNEEFQKRRGRLGDTIFSKEDRVAMREQAQRLLEGKERWRSGKEARA